MANTTQSPNMLLSIPVSGVDPGPQYSLDVNSCLTVIDGHNHSPGSGVQITPSGLNLNANLPFNSNAAIGLSFLNLSTLSANPSTLVSLYSKGVDLYFLDGSGNAIQLTAGGTVNATSSGIASGTATASFAAGVLVVNSASNTPANIQVASVLLGNNVANSKYLTLSPPNSMASNYGLTLPALPSSQSFMTIDTSGNMAGYAPIANGITRSNLAAVGQQVSASCGNFTSSSGAYTPITNLSVTITTSGRPVMIMFISDGSSSAASFGSYFGANNSTLTTAAASVQVSRGATALTYQTLAASSGTTESARISVPPGALNTLDTPAAGTYTYSAAIATLGSGAQAVAFYMQMVAYEL